MNHRQAAIARGRGHSLRIPEINNTLAVVCEPSSAVFCPGFQKGRVPSEKGTLARWTDRQKGTLARWTDRQKGILARWTDRQKRTLARWTEEKGHN